MMRRKRWIQAACIGLFAALAAAVSFAPARAETTRHFVVVVNKARPENDISRRDLRKMFLGDKKFWEGGSPVQSVLPPKAAGEAKDELVTLLTNLTPEEFNREWEGKVFRGESTRPPVVLPTDKDTIGYLYMVPNAVAVLPAESLGKYEKVVKVLTVDGKHVGDEGYGL